jgi:anionic cell wall polymer biosynthesis LytR-Cps2A-Psr (LCP) family protein
MQKYLLAIGAWLRKPMGAAVLSFIFPGLGQATGGQPRRGGIVAIPALAVLGAFLLILIIARGSLLNSAFDQSWLTSLLILDMVAFVYHIWAVADAYLVASKSQAKPRRRGPMTVKWASVLGIAIIVSSTVVVHGAFASVDMNWQNDVSCWTALTPCFGNMTGANETIPIPSNDPQDQTIPTDPASGSVPPNSTASTAVGTFDPSSLPSFTVPTDSKNWAADGQLNILLVGVDSGNGGSRNSGLRPDTMMVLHEDIKTGRAALISVPRNLMCVPLPQAIAQHYAKAQNGCPAYTWPYMLNWLANDAGWNHPGYYPFDQGTGMQYTRAVDATVQAIETLTGLTPNSGHPIDGFVVINLMGLVNLIDALGGIDINVPTQTYDKPCGKKGTWQAAYRVCSLTPPHDGYGLPEADGKVPQKMIDDAKNSNGMQTITYMSKNGYDIGFTIKAGKQHMDGDWALAYARTRIYTSDYDRNKRQQLVLKSLRSTLDPCTVLPRVGNIITSLGSAFWTNMPPGDIDKWAGMAKYITGDNVQSIELAPGTGSGSIGTSTYINTASWAKAQSLVAHSLDNAPAATSGGSGGGGGGGFSC